MDNVEMIIKEITDEKGQLLDAARHPSRDYSI